MEKVFDDYKSGKPDIFTGELTNSLTHGYPVAPSSREYMKEQHVLYNEMLNKKFTERVIKKNDEDLNDDLLDMIKKLAPKLGLKRFLEQVNTYGIDKLFKETDAHGSSEV